MFTKVILAAVLTVAAASSHAAGPDEIAVGDRSTWPQPIDSPERFDLASRAELLAFGHALAATEQLSDAELQKQLKIKSFDHDSVDRIRAKFWQRLTKNYLVASAGCTNGQPFCVRVQTETDFRNAALASSVPAQSVYAPWASQAATFHRAYVNELLRLAALFPRVNSEIDTFSPRELDGSTLPDRNFLLTFDDGPTSAGGTTDTVLRMLRDQHLNGVFFTIGPPLQNRLQQTGVGATANAYRGMCVGAHGWEHRSHSTWTDWQDSVTRSIGLVHDNLPDNYVPMFRPPYGQRRPDSGPFFASQGLFVALWNIDSQDWNTKVPADDVKQRVLTLMLLWRHGIILFHDVHPKAQVAVPWLNEQLSHAGIIWQDCRQFAARAEQSQVPTVSR
jgi:peptidoglycan-N-acetylglucosamine deacetylase